MIKYTATVECSNLDSVYHEDFELYFFDKPDDALLKKNILDSAKKRLGIRSSLRIVEVFST